MAVIGSMVGGHAQADPAADALAKLNELSRQAEQTTEAMHAAKLDLKDKLAVQKAAEEKQAADQSTLDTANAKLDEFQRGVNRVAAAAYMGGRTDGFSAIMTAASPQQLIDQMSVRKVMGAQMGVQMRNFREMREKAVTAAAESQKSATEARTAAEQAAAVRADLQSKQSRLQVQIAVVKSQYAALTPDQRTALAAPAPAPVVPPEQPPVPAPGEQPPVIEAAAPPGGVPAPEAIAPPEPSGQRAVAVQAALSRIGSPYSWGGSGPSSFDCSGLVMWAFQQAGISLPHSSQALARGGQPVPMGELQPGDVVNYYSDASHSAIYIGDGMMVHASTYGTPVRVAPVTNAPIYNVRRY